MIPNTIGWACAPTAPKLERYILPALQQLIPTDWVASYSSEFGDIRLKNGSLIHLQTLEDPDQGRGQGLDWLWIDEASELTEDHWHVIRPSLTERRGGAFITTSPRSYDWVYDQFYHKAEEGVPGYWACKYATSENPIISAAEVAEAKASMPDTMFRQEYEADFVIFTGSVYGSLIDPQILRTDDQTRQVIPEWPDIADWRQVVVGLDTGADHPFGAVKAVSTEKGLVVVGEYLERHRTFAEHAGSVKMLASSSTAKWAINKNERQPMIELAQHGIRCQGAENDVVAGTERVKTWLHRHQLWFVESRCPMTIKQMKAYRWAPDKSKDGQVRPERVYKLNDELPDCFVAGTLISTKRGDVPIETVTDQDQVLTRVGYRPVEIVGSRYVSTHHLVLSNGTSLIGTATHPIWTTKNGFVELAKLHAGDQVLPVTQITTAAEHEGSGQRSMVPFQKVMRSIIGTLTAPITQLTISGACLLRSIRSFIEPSVVPWSPKLVGFATRILRRGQDIKFTAQTTVSQLIDAVGMLMRSHEIALVVGNHSRSTNIAGFGTVPSHAGSDITNVSPVRLSAFSAETPQSRSLNEPDTAVTVVGSVPTGLVERVYNMSVKEQPEYFANGILVHNCIRYFCMTWPRLPDGPPPVEIPVRDLTLLPAEMRGAIERMRRLEAVPKDPDDSNLSHDFFA